MSQFKISNIKLRAVLGATLGMLSGLISFSIYEGKNEWILTKTLNFSSKLLQPFTKLEFHCEKASGSLRSGNLLLKNFHLKRTSHWKSLFDFEGKKFELRYTESLLSWIKHPKQRLLQPINVEKLHIEGLSGSLEILVSDPDNLDILINDLSLTDTSIQLIDSRAQFPINSKFKNYADLIVQKKNRLQYPSLKLNSFTSQNFRTSKASFDILFRSQISGTLDGKSFFFGKDNGKLVWKLESLPISLFHQIFLPPLGSIQSASFEFDVEIADLSTNDDYFLQGSVGFKDIQTVQDQTLANSLLDMYLKRNSPNLSVLIGGIIHEKNFQLISLFKIIRDCLTDQLLQQGKEKLKRYANILISKLS